MSRMFTLPHDLIPLCQNNATVLYDLLFRANAATMLEVAKDPKHLGAEIGFLSILHTWGQNLASSPPPLCRSGGRTVSRSQELDPSEVSVLPAG